MLNSENYNWDSHHRQLVLEGRQILERTGESIARSNQIAIETEQIGTEVASELGEQRESLLRTHSRLETANVQLDKARNLLRKIGRGGIYNKFILILIILLECGILIGLVYLKYIH